MGAKADREVVLVTGFPRLVARLVVSELLERSPTRIVKLLVRPKFLSEAAAFVQTHANGDRIELLEGDAAAIDLGLSGPEYRDLASNVDYVQHHALITYEGADRKSAEALNVQGAREVLEFAKASKRLKRLVHQSTVRVSGDHEGTFREDDLDVGQAFRSAIEETHHRAERLMRRAMPSVPITVVRPAITVGHSLTGEVDRFDGFYLLVLLILTSPVEITLPMPTRGNVGLNLVPVDYVARASVALMTEPAATNKTFHLVDASPLPARRVYELVARVAGRKLPRGFIPVNLTRTLLRTPGLERFVKSPRAFFEQLATPVTYTSSGAREVLGPKGIQCPRLENYVDPLVTHVRETLDARRARQEELTAEVDDPLA